MKVTERRQEVAARYLHGEYQSAIAKTLGVSQAQISKDLHVIRRHWLASTLRDFDAAKAQELAKIDAAERAYWDGWQRSQQPREVSLTEATEGGPDGPKRKASMRREGQAGDPRFLDGVLACVRQRCAILGLSAETEALKDASMGLAALLDQARQLAAQPPPQRPLAEA